ncbi:MAG: ATP-dependent zinc metalloprotease FtsH [Anaerolineae bacterium]|nr:ATP-dependent zinc metalloprotease FtsH [Anaerolineae bacterium]
MTLQKNKPSQPEIPKKIFPGWIWWLIFIGLLIWNILSFWPAPTPEVTIPYTTFVDQVKADNVSAVKITGDSITGQFAQPFTWPQPPAASPTASAQPTASPAASPQPTASASPETYTEFVTTFPEVVGDRSLIPLLEDHQVMINVESLATPWFMTLLINGLPILLLIGFFIWMGSRAAKNQANLFGFGQSKVRPHVGEHPQVTFEDVAGADEAKRDLQEVVDFLRRPDRYYNLGAHIPRGVLLVGPPGTGKTLLARAVAGEAGVPFFNLSASEFVEMFVGVGASRVRDLFQQAKAAAPAIVFIDELDAVGRRRGAGLGAVNDEREQTLNQLLAEMDGFDERLEVILLAATNRPDVLDPALLRPGRFDREVVVNLPDRPGREGILRIHTRGLPLSPSVDLADIARATTGMSGADLANLCNEAALLAARYNHRHIERVDFDEAIDKILLGAARTLMMDEHERRVIAYHEAGHALVAWLTPQADPVHKVTIIPRGRALGVTEQLPEDDHYNYSRTYLLARLAVMLGGRAAEDTVIGDITTGAENDLVQATRLARRMITRWGMGELGTIAFETDEEQPFLGYELARGRDYSEATAAQIDEEVQQLLAERYQTVCRLLTDAREQLDALAEALLRDETIDRDQLAKILGTRVQLPEKEAAVA